MKKYIILFVLMVFFSSCILLKYNGSKKHRAKQHYKLKSDNIDPSPQSPLPSSLEPSDIKTQPSQQEVPELIPAQFEPEEKKTVEIPEKSEVPSWFPHFNGS